MGRPRKLPPAEVVTAETSDAQLALIADIIQKVSSKHNTSIGTLEGQYAVKEKVSGVIPTGSIGLDRILGVGGWPRGRIVEIFGAESSGKTTLTLHAIAEAQKMGLIAAFVDAEHALDPQYAKNIGVDLRSLLIEQPDSGEQALDVVETLAKTGHVGIIVVDSVAALVPRAELEGDMGDQRPGAHARLMSQAMRKLTAAVSNSNTLVIFINQTRMKIGVTYGSPETTTGGEALKFYSSVRLKVYKGSSLSGDDKSLGTRSKYTVIKNKVAPPHRSVEVDIVYGRGIDRDAELLDFAVEKGIIHKSGSWYSIEDTRIGQGRDASIAWLSKLDTEKRQWIVDQVNSALNA